MSTVPLEEIAWGEGQERAVVTQWVRVSPIGRKARRFVKSLEFDPYDVLVLADKGMPLCALEVKVRRVAFGEYGDVMAPMRKHEFGIAMRALGFPFLLVTAYACGTLVEVDLSESPIEVKPIARRDRPGMTPVKHGFWQGPQLRIFPGEAA